MANTYLPNVENSIDLTDESISKIYITGGGFVRREFRGCGADSQFGWQELVWKSQPSRGGTFAFTNMDDIDVGLVARCEVNIMYMNIQDYMDLRKIIARERHFTVEFFDIDEGIFVSRDMYCSENSRNKLLILSKHLIGVANIPIKFVGTNLDVVTTIDADGNEITTDKELSIVYEIDSGSGTVSDKNEDGTTVYKTAKYGEQRVLSDGTGVIAPQNKNLKYWVTRNKNGDISGTYGLGQSVTVWKGMTLYPYYENA